MPTQTIVQYNNPILRQSARALTIADIQHPDMSLCLDDMVDTMRAAPGVGLAAPQIAYLWQLFIVEDQPRYHQNISTAVLHERQRVPVALEIFFNPQLTIVDSTHIYYYEGCLSCGEFCWIVPRAKQIKISYYNRDGEACELVASGWLARILQHEYDHLQGKILYDNAAQQTRITMSEYREDWLNSTAEQVRAQYEKLMNQ